MSDCSAAINALVAAVNAIERELGIEPGITYYDVKAKLDILEHRSTNNLPPLSEIENPFYIGNSEISVSVGSGVPTEDRLPGSLYLRTDSSSELLYSMGEDLVWHLIEVLVDDEELTISAGTQSISSGTVIFSNSNGLSFGMSNNSIISGSYTVPSTAGLISNINISAGTTSNNLSAITFSNSNNVSFGINGSIITASVNTIAPIINFSAGTTSNNLSAITFSNSNGISFGLNGSTITVSIIPGAALINISAGSTSNDLTAITFSNSNGLSFGLNGSVITGSYTVPPEALLAAGTQTASGGSVVFSNSNRLSFGMSDNTRITGSYNFNASAGTTSNNLNSINFSNANGVSFGLNGSIITASIVPRITNINITAGTTTFNNNLSAITFSNSNGLSFGLNGSVITGSYTVPNIIKLVVGTDIAGAGSVVFSNSNNISFGMSGSSRITASYNFNVSASNTSSNLTGLRFSNSNGVSFGLNNNILTASVATGISNINVSAGTTSNDLASLTFSNSNGFAFGITNSLITASYTVPSIIISASTQSKSTGGFSFVNNNSISFGMSGSDTITASYRFNVRAGTITATSSILNSLLFNDGNNISFGLNSNTITASVLSQTDQKLNFYAINNTIGQSSSTTADIRSVSFNGSGIASVGLSGGSIIIGAQNVVKLYATSNTSEQSSTVIDLNSAIFSGRGIVSVGHSSNSFIINVPEVGGSINVSAGSTNNDVHALLFSNSNGVKFGLNDNTITMSADPPMANNFFEPYPFFNGTVVATANSTNTLLYPFLLPIALDSGKINFFESCHSSSASATGLLRVFTGNIASNIVGSRGKSYSHIKNVALYAFGKGTNSSNLEMVWSNTASFGLSQTLSISNAGTSARNIINGATLSYLSINSNGMYNTISITGSAITSVATNSSFSSIQYSNLDITNIINALTGAFVFPVGLNTSISAGNYYIARNNITSTSFAGTNVDIYNHAGEFYLTSPINTNCNIFGQTNPNLVIGIIPKQIMFSSTGFPNTIAYTNSNLSYSNNTIIPYFYIDNINN